uniref:Transposase n=1 Tax=Caenorhabditis tropicalis TaxID=1561998 RepID=A0A1I7UQA5_9PELO
MIENRKKDVKDRKEICLQYLRVGNDQMNNMEMEVEIPQHYVKGTIINVVKEKRNEAYERGVGDVLDTALNANT